MTRGEGISRLLPLDGSFIALWEASRVIARMTMRELVCESAVALHSLDLF